ncbi:terminal organelle tip protein HMW2 [Mycoplasmoides genitalium]|uniref:terminal organelle tip protein HMW2 n=1 Tax=Mycoplasmoides genitalium TaxID=2097 RepID=UPI002FCE67F2
MKPFDKKPSLQPIYDIGFDDGYLQSEYEKNRSKTDVDKIENQLLKEIKSLEDELKNLKGLKNQAEDNPELDKKINHLEVDLNRLVNEYKNFQFQKNHMVDKVSELDNLTRFYKNELTRLQQENADFLNSKYANLANFQANYHNKLNDFHRLIENQNHTINRLNQKINGNQNLIDNNVALLQNPNITVEKKNYLLNVIDQLYNELDQLENQKRLLSIEYENTYRELVSADNELQNVYENIDQNQIQFKHQYQTYRDELSQLERKIQLTKQELVDKESALRVKIDDADFYINARLAELDDVAKQLSFQDGITKQNAQHVEDKLVALNKEKDRLNTQKEAFFNLRQSALIDINKLQQENELFAKHLEHQQNEFEQKQSDSLLKLETEYKALQHKINEFKNESATKSEELLNQERELFEKRREIDTLLTQASLEYEHQRESSQLLKDKQNEVKQHFQNLEYAKKELDKERNLLDQQKKVDSEAIFQLKEKVAQERKELEELYLVKKQKQDQKENELLFFEKQLKQHQADFENELEAKQQELFEAKHALERSFIKLEDKEKDLNTKAQQIANEFSQLKTDKSKSADFELMLQNEYENLQQEKQKLFQERTYFERNAAVLSNRLQQKREELLQQKETLDQLTKSFEQERLINQREHKELVASVEKQKEILGKKLQDFSQTSLNASKNLAEREMAIKFKEKEIEATEKQLLNDVNNAEVIQADLAQLNQSLNQERSELQNAKQRIADFHNDSLKKLNEYELSLQKRLQELQTLEANQKQHSYQNQAYFEGELDKLNREKQAFLNLRKKQTMEVDAIKQKLSDKHQALNMQQAELDRKTHELNNAFLNHDADQKSLQDQLATVKETQKLIDLERSALLEKQREFAENVAGFKRHWSNKTSQLQKIYELTKKQESEQTQKETELKIAFSDLQKDYQVFELQKDQEFRQIEAKQRELDKLAEKNNQVKLELDNRFQALQNQKQDTVQAQLELEREQHQLNLEQTAFNQANESLLKQREQLTKKIQAFHYELKKRNQFLALKGKRLFAKEQDQQRKDQEINWRFKQFEKEYTDFDEAKKRELEELEKIRRSLSQSNVELERKREKLATDFTNLNKVQHNTQINRDQLNSQIRQFLLERKNFQRFSNEANAKKAFLIKRLRSFASNLKLQKEALAIQKLEFDKRDEQQKKELQQATLQLEQFKFEKQNFDIEKQRQLVAIKTQCEKLSDEKKALNQKLVELKNLSQTYLANKNKAEYSQQQLQQKYTNLLDLKENLERTKDQLDKKHRSIFARLTKFANDLRFEKKQLLKAQRIVDDKNRLLKENERNLHFLSNETERKRAVLEDQISYFEKQRKQATDAILASHKEVKKKEGELQKLLVELETRKTKLNNDFAKFSRQREEFENQRLKLLELQKNLQTQTNSNNFKTKAIQEIENSYKRGMEELNFQKKEFDKNKSRLYEYFRKMRDEIERKESQVKLVLKETQRKANLLEAQANKLNIEKNTIDFKEKELKAFKDKVDQDIDSTNKQRKELNELLNENKLLQQSLIERERAINSKDSLLNKKIETIKRQLHDKEMRVLRLVDRMKLAEQKYQTEINRLRTQTFDSEKQDIKNFFPPLFKINGNDMAFPYLYPWLYPQQKQDDNTLQIRQLFEQQLQFMQQRYENELNELRRQRNLLEKKLDQIQLESQLNNKQSEFSKVESMMEKLLEKTESRLNDFDQKINYLTKKVNQHNTYQPSSYQPTPSYQDSDKQQLLFRIQELEKQNLFQQQFQPAPAVVQQPTSFAAPNITKQQQIAQLNAEINNIKRLIAQKAASK